MNIVHREIIPNAGTVGMILEFQKDIPIQSLTYYYKPFSQKEPKYYGYRVDGVNFVKAEKGFFVAKRENIPAFREEPYMPPEDAVRPWIKLRGRTYSFLAVTASVFGIDPSSFLTKYTAKDPSNPQYWGIFAGENSHFVKFIIKENKEIRKVAEEITASAKTDDEKLRAIYEFCQRQIRNLSFEPADSIAEDEAKKLRKIDSIGDILKNRKGYSAHIDMLFGAMASSLGYEVRIAFASDRSELFFDPAVNDEDLVRPAAIAVKVGNQWKLFNPGVKFLPYGMLLWYEEDVPAILVGEKLYAWIRTPLSTTEQNLTKRKGNFVLTAEGALEGEVQMEFYGQEAITRRLALYRETQTKREEEITEEIKKRVKNSEILELRIENLDDNSKPLIYKFKIKIPSYAQKLGRRMVFQPGFFEYGRAPVFSASQRTHDIYFNYPWSEQDEISIVFPEGFELESASSPGEMADKDRIGFLDIRMSLTSDKKTLLYKRNYHFGGGGNILFPAQVYSQLKVIFDTFHKADSHQLVLLKKN